MEILTTRTRGVKAKSLLAFFTLALVMFSVHAQEATAPEAADDPVARSIVEKADQVRFPAEG